MPDGQVLEFSGVTKRFGDVTAVSDFSARVEPGQVTGFLGPNGAGKTTSLRILLGLVRPTAGSATIGGQPYAKLRHPLQTVGAVLEASSFHPGRSAANHLKVYAQAASLPVARVDEALATVGLAEVAGRKVGGFSLGMRQRLGLAYALLGDPGVLVLDEPANGLDPEGIKWMRGLLRQLARQGRTVLVSSHLLTEVQQTVDALLIVSQGRLVFQGGLTDLTDPSEYVTVVDAPDRAALSQALRDGGVDFEVLRSGLTVRGVDTAAVGSLAAGAGIALSALQRRGPGLEEVFLDLVNGTRVHESATAGLAPLSADDGTADETASAASGDDAAAPVAAVAGAAVVAGAADDETAAADEPMAGETADGETDASGVPADDMPADPAAEAPHPHAAFAVASTGVIDIVPDDEAPAEDAAPDVDEPESGEAPETGSDHVWAMPAAPAEAEPDAEPEVAPAEAESDAEAQPVEAEASEAEASEAEAEHVWAMPPAEPHEEPAAESPVEADAFAAPPVDESADAAWPEPDGEPAPEPAADRTEEPATEEPAAEEPAADAAPGPKLWTWPADDEPAPATAGPEQDVAESWQDAPETQPISYRPDVPPTEADAEADRFFSGFDAGDQSAPSEAEGPVETSEQTPPASDPSSDDEMWAEPPAHTGNEHEGGEQR